MTKTEEEAIKYAETQASVFMFPSDKEAGIAKINNKFGFMAGAEWQKKKAIEAFKENCQRPKDTEPCECKLCVRWVGGHCELLDGFIEKLNS